MVDHVLTQVGIEMKQNDPLDTGKAIYYICDPTVLGHVCCTSKSTTLCGRPLFRKRRPRVIPSPLQSDSKGTLMNSGLFTLRT